MPDPAAPPVNDASNGPAGPATAGAAGADADMADTDAVDAAARASAAGSSALASLREILVGPEQRGVASLEARLDDEERRTAEIGAVLPRVLARHAGDPELTKALAPSVEKAITASVQRNPRPLADALFPVMGPAIRKAVAAGLAGMVESLNRTLELALSRRSIAWRIEAWRTGRSFGEVVLSKTLLYRVEQLFLIDRNSGLLLQHVAADVEGVRDADMVSGMLTAIRDFVKDSFDVAEQDSLGALEVGELRVLIEAGPHAAIAAVVRGAVPHDYRDALVEAVEAVHFQFGEVLADFRGDASVLDGSRPILEQCLQTRFVAEQRAPRRRGAGVLLALGLTVLLVWLAFSVRAERRGQRYLEALRAQPGITVVAAERSRGRLIVTGLRDPLAGDALPLLAAAGLSAGDVREQWTPYQSLDPEMVLLRAIETLQPPAGVTLSLADGVLTSDGAAPGTWLAETRRMAPFLAGIRRFEAGASAVSRLRAVEAELTRATVLFPVGGTVPESGFQQAIEELAAQVRELGALADAAGVRLRLDIIGHTDDDGPPSANLSLSRARAEAVRAALVPAASEALVLRADGVGSTQPVAPGRTEADKRRNRRVALEVTRLE
jgi:outer membrane protein OmpA-like peptidoglycan-associated protein